MRRRLDRDEYIDEVRIRTVPRFKTSGLSGDEWRTSTVLQFVRKGHVLYERTSGTVEHALKVSLVALATYGETQEHMVKPKIDLETLCDQPGCSEPATNLYKVKKVRLGNSHHMEKPALPSERAFCNKHAHRGDSDFEDCDANLELIKGRKFEGKGNIPKSDLSPAKFAGVVEVGSLEEIPGKVEELRRSLKRGKS